ncbi:MAG: hypothetical protein HWE14_11150 [Flavobacteriia bacterium]|nr:hypothetical protein [Flavobacteriia bacterium]
MKIRLVVIAILSLIFISCSRDEQLAKNETFQEVFNDSEIRDLQVLFDFFNEEICARSNNEDLDDCYRHFLEKVKSQADSNYVILDISFQKQLNVYDQISDSTLHQIWWKGWSRRPLVSTTDTFVYLNVYPPGKYYEFLDRLGDDYEIVQEYHDHIVSFGDYSPSLLTGVQRSFEKFNISDIRVKFLFAIHYLTVNDHLWREERW